MANLLTTSQVAALFSVASHTIRRWVQDGLLEPARTVGGHLRFEIKNVSNLLAARGFSIDERAIIPAETPAPEIQLRVLIVDDEKSVIDEVLDCLRNQNIVCETARDGFEAGLQISRFKPHIVFLDLLLPGVDGFRICQEIRKNEETRDLTVITMTGFGTDNFVAQALNAGADECLTKPLDSERVVALVRDTARRINESSGEKKARVAPEDGRLPPEDARLPPEDGPENRAASGF
jgi:excisionase family DNA binding protein